MHVNIQCTWSKAEQDLLPSLQTSMVYPSRPDGPMFSGWLQMMVTEVSFLSSTKSSTGALVGSADAKKIHNYPTDILQVAEMHKNQLSIQSLDL